MPSVNNTLIGAVRGEASLESGKFVAGAKKIQVASKQTEAQVKSSFSAMGTAVKGFGGALTAGLSIGLLGGLAKKALDFATSIKDVAAQVGVSTKALQEFRYAASQVGIKQADADKGLEKFNLTLGKAAAGSATAQKALAAVGVTMVDVKNKTPIESFGKMADQINRQGGAAKNAAPLNAVLGESYAKLNPLVAQGSKGLDELSQAANRLGIVLSDQQIQNADETARKLDDVKQVLAAQIAGVVADNASSIVSLAQALGQLTSAIINFLGSNPTAALAILGGLAGSRFGLPGAALGAVVGASAGGRLEQANEDANLNPRFRQQKFREARARLAKAQGLSSKTAPDAQLLSAQRELDKQRELAKQAIAAARRPTGSTTATNVPQFLAGAPKAGRKGRTPRAPRDRSDDVTFQFDQELRRTQIDVLRAQQSLAHTADERAAIALQLLDAEKAMQEAELQDRVRRAERDFAEGKITAGALEQVKAQAEKLKAEYDSVDALQRQAIAEELAADKAHDAVELDQSARDLKIEQLQYEASLAETAAERRDVELRILAAMKEQERARLEAVIADQQSSELAKAQAQQRLGELDAVYAGREAGVRQGTRGPYEDWMSSLPTTAAKMQEAFEQLEVQGFEGLIDAALALSKGFDSAKDALLDTLKQFLLGFARAQLQSAVGSILPAGGFTLPKFAGGGSFTVGGMRGLDRNTLMLNGIPIANVSYGERVSVSNDNSSRQSDARGGVTVNVMGVRDFDSFRRNERQTGRTVRRQLGI